MIAGDEGLNRFRAVWLCSAACHLVSGFGVWRW